MKKILLLFIMMFILITSVSYDSFAELNNIYFFEYYLSIHFNGSELDINQTFPAWNNQTFFERASTFGGNNQYLYIVQSPTDIQMFFSSKPLRYVYDTSLNPDWWLYVQDDSTANINMVRYYNGNFTINNTFSNRYNITSSNDTFTIKTNFTGNTDPTIIYYEPPIPPPNNNIITLQPNESYYWLNQTNESYPVSTFQADGIESQLKIESQNVGNTIIYPKVTDTPLDIMIDSGNSIRITNLSENVITVVVPNVESDDFVYDENATVNILSPENYYQTVMPYFDLVVQVSYPRIAPNKVLFRRNDGLVWSPLDDFATATVVEDNSTLLRIDRTYKFSILLVRNEHNKIEVFTRNILGQTTGSQTINVIHKIFEDADGDGYDDMTGQNQYDGSINPLDTEPMSSWEAMQNAYSGQTGLDNLPDITNIAGTLTAASGQVSSFLSSIFGFLPPDLLAIMLLGLASVVILRILGR